MERGVTDAGRSHAVALLGVLLIAANLRAAISAVGPVLPTLAADLGLSGAEQGMLTAAPVAAFAVFSLLAQPLARRWGVERTVTVALLLTGAGIAARSLPVPGLLPAALFVGTAVLGGGIAIANVLLPVVVRRDFGPRTPAVTGYYIAVQSAVAAAASAVVVPVAVATGSWRAALGIWCVPVLFAVLARVARRRAMPGARAPRPVAPAFPSARAWRSGVAWMVAGYFGLQSSIFYVMLSWLPTIEQELGVTPSAAGVHLGIFLLTGIVANLVVPAWLRLGPDERFAAASIPALLLVALAGLAFLPGLVVLWVALAGFVLGAAMVVALSLIALRGDPEDGSGALSSMVQGVGYAGVTLWLLAMGVLVEATGSALSLLGPLAVLALVEVAVGLLAGHPRRRV